MNGEHESMKTHASGGWAGPRWLAVAVAAAIGVIWILPAMALRAGCGPTLAAIIARALPRVESRWGDPGPAYAW